MLLKDRVIAGIDSVTVKWTPVFGPLVKVEYFWSGVMLLAEDIVASTGGFDGTGTTSL